MEAGASFNLKVTNEWIVWYYIAFPCGGKIIFCGM